MAPPPARLLDIPWYRSYIQDRQMVMIGYSDSAKDASMMAAGWAQYKAQEQLLEICSQAGVALTLFHGRGAVVVAAGFSQQRAESDYSGGDDPGAIGAVCSCHQYAGLVGSAMLTADLERPPVPKPQWRQVMESLSAHSCSAYRQLVRGNSNFIEYFRMATPEQELAKLPLGSRPAKRRQGGGVETLRAIPWIFAWSQNRLMLPTWLGVGQALQKEIDEGNQGLLEVMCQQWPFFHPFVAVGNGVHQNRCANLGVLRFTVGR